MHAALAAIEAGALHSALATTGSDYKLTRPCAALLHVSDRIPSRQQTKPCAAELAARGATWSDVLFVTLSLAAMSHFAAANAAYRAVVPQAAAPARACVELPHSGSFRCSADALVRRPAAAAARDAAAPHSDTAAAPRRDAAAAVAEVAAERTVLHVQSVSRWAPACIGPYSQAVRCGGLLCIAGQIPLEPASMQACSSLTTIDSFDHMQCLIRMKCLLKMTESIGRRAPVWWK